MSEKSTVCHLTSAHSDGDIRIFRKLAISSAENYKTYCIVPNAKSRLEENVHVIGFRSTPRSRLMRMISTVNIVLDEAIKVQADIYHLHDPELLRVVKKLKHQTGAKGVEIFCRWMFLLLRKSLLPIFYIGFSFYNDM